MTTTAAVLGGNLPGLDLADPAMETDNWGVRGVPCCDLDDPAQVEAWFAAGSFSHYEHYRKVVLSQCEELVRAAFATKGEKIAETRITSLARLHENYLEYLHDSLIGRTTRERNFRERVGV